MHINSTYGMDCTMLMAGEKKPPSGDNFLFYLILLKY